MRRFRKYVVFISIFLFSIQAHANMAAPWIDGTSNTDIYISKDIDILKEYLTVILSDYYHAEFDVRYIVRSESMRMQVPFVFDTYAGNNKYGRGRDDHMDFRIYLDDKEIEVQDIPYIYREDTIREQWTTRLRNNFDLNLDDLSSFKYFKLDLTEGEHMIRVRYTAGATVDLWGDVRKYTFVYNLKPAKLWKSFGGLELTIDASSVVDGEVSVNLAEGEFVDGVYKCYFDNLPQDEFTVICRPGISAVANFFINIGAGGLAVFIIVCLAALHMWTMRRYRKQNPGKRFSWVAIAGGLFVPFIFCFLLVYTNYFIDWIIGEHASSRHGYVFLYFFLYPVFLVIYLIPVFIVDRFFKKRTSV